MQNQTILPHIGELLRSLITRAGYRQRITELGCDKDLDDLASENRLGSSCDLLGQLEETCAEMLNEYIGQEWTQFVLKDYWPMVRESVQVLALHVDTSVIAEEQGLRKVEQVFVLPMLTGFARLAEAKIPGPKLGEEWWESPFQVWVRWVSEETGISQQQLLDAMANHADIDARTLPRWLGGEVIEKLRWPFRPIVRGVVETHKQPVPDKLLDKLTIWLMIAVTYQSLPDDQRAALRRHASSRIHQVWTIESAIEQLNTLGLATGDPSIKDQYIPILDRIEDLFSVSPIDQEAIHIALSEFQAVTSAETDVRRRFYQYIYDRYAARLYALVGEQEKAVDFYGKAVNGVWWCGGLNQKAIIEEALLYAVGMGDIVAAKRYWDKTFMLGINRLPKRKLDKMERRRLAYGFEQRFYPLQAKERVLLNTEVIVGDFKLDPRALSAPNRKIKHAEGRTRRTPLMDAIFSGTLQDVKKLLDAGGDPNDFIKESGEGPLSYAMRRACNRKDPAIMDALLKLPLTKETVNRSASTLRETPLKIAIEMADAKAVARLIELGADIEAKCDNLPTALCYAVNLLYEYESIHNGNAMELQAGHTSGKTPADADDAKRGTVLDIDLAESRSAHCAVTRSSTEFQAISKEVMDYFARPIEDCKQVIRVLLEHGADANCRYKTKADTNEEWTPTLFAAQIGDVELFKILVENGGNPDLTIEESSSPFEQLNALWVAVSYKRQSIVKYLQNRRQP